MARYQGGCDEYVKQKINKLDQQSQQFCLITGNLKIESFKRNLRTFFTSRRSYCLKLKYSTDSFILFFLFLVFCEMKKENEGKNSIENSTIEKKKTLQTII